MKALMRGIPRRQSCPEWGANRSPSAHSVAAEELFQFRGLGGIGWTRNDRLQQITKVLSGPDRKELERVGHHVGVGSTGQVILDGDATGIAASRRHSRHPSAIREAPVTRIVLPLNSAARLSRAAAGEALKLPSTTTPFA